MDPEASSGAPEARTLGVARVAFAERFSAYVDYRTEEADPLSRERDAIQLFILTLVKLLLLLGGNKQAPMLLEYLQKAMGDTVTPKGLQRPLILGKGQELLAEPPEAPKKDITLALKQEEEARLAVLEIPPGEEGLYYPVTAVFFLQYLLKTLSEPSLFYLMLVMGGLMEYYEKIGKTTDLAALTAGPAYAFSTASRYIEEERRRSAGPEA
ncbi:MAG TPA: hypothetical protein VFR02_09850 [bacterium]|nr:hypothetical protein [bacterium]